MHDTWVTQADTRINDRDTLEELNRNSIRSVRMSDSTHVTRG